MIKSSLVRWVSVVVVGALAVGCGSRAERPNGAQAQAPAACVPPPADTLKPPAPPVTAAAPAPTMSATAVAAAPAPKPATRPAKAKVLDAPLKVKRLVVAEDVERGKREPVGESTAFKAADIDKLYAFVEVENPTTAESEVFVTFEPEGDGASQGQVSLRVGASPRWRTWAYTRGVKKAGNWAAVVRSADGKVLARAPFSVTL